jgi:hypothetical protein
MRAATLGAIATILLATTALGAPAYGGAPQAVAPAPLAAAPIPPPAVPFPQCPNLGFQVHTPFGANSSTLGYFDLLTSTFVPIKDLGLLVNAIGYDRSENVFWGMGVGTVPDHLLRIDSVGNVEDFGPLNNSGPVPAPPGLVTVTGTVFNALLGGAITLGVRARRQRRPRPR